MDMNSFEYSGTNGNPPILLKIREGIYDAYMHVGRFGMTWNCGFEDGKKWSVPRNFKESSLTYLGEIKHEIGLEFSCYNDDNWRFYVSLEPMGNFTARLWRYCPYDYFKAGRKFGKVVFQANFDALKEVNDWIIATYDRTTELRKRYSRMVNPHKLIHAED